MTSRKISRDYLAKVEARAEALRLFLDAVLAHKRGSHLAVACSSLMRVRLVDYAANLTATDTPAFAHRPTR